MAERILTSNYAWVRSMVVDELVWFPVDLTTRWVMRRGPFWKTALTYDTTEAGPQRPPPPYLIRYFALFTRLPGPYFGWQK